MPSGKKRKGHKMATHKRKKKIEKKSSQKEIIYFLVGFENTQEQTEDPAVVSLFLCH